MCYASLLVEKSYVFLYESLSFVFLNVNFLGEQLAAVGKVNVVTR